MTLAVELLNEPLSALLRCDPPTICIASCVFHMRGPELTRRNMVVYGMDAYATDRPAVDFVSLTSL